MKGFINDIIARPLYWLFSWTGNYPLALILFLILLRLIFVFFDWYKSRTLVKTKLSKPFVSKIKEKFLGKDSTKFQNATLEIFDITKTSQFSNIIPLIIEYPIILAVFYSLYHPVSVLFPTLKDSVPAMAKIAATVSDGMFEELNIINAVKISPELFSGFKDVSLISELNTKLFGKIDIISSANSKSWSIICPILLLSYFAYLIIKLLIPVIKKQKTFKQVGLPLALYLFVGICVSISAFTFPIVFYLYFAIFNLIGFAARYILNKVTCKSRRKWIEETNKKCQDVLIKYGIEDYVSAITGEPVKENENVLSQNSEIENPTSCVANSPEDAKILTEERGDVLNE